MQYQLKEKIWSFRDSYTIRDKRENAVFYVKGKVFSWGDKLSFQDSTGKEVLYISQKLFSLKPRYKICKDGEMIAEAIKEWTWFKKKFTLNVPGPNDYTIRGSFWEHEFEFERQGKVVARVSKSYFSLSDSYGVDILDGEDDAAILATVVVIDLILHEDKEKESTE